MIKALLAKGAKTNGTAVLDVASCLTDLDRIQLLLEYGAGVIEALFISITTFVNYRYGGTPVHWAFAGGRSEAVELLLDH